MQSLLGAEWRRGTVCEHFDLPVGSVPCIAWLQPAPATLTGEDKLELLLPGHPQILRETEERLRALGCRDAEPGEFTRRAVEAGRMSLAQAEATLALVTATDEVSRRQALADLAGDSAKQLKELTDELRALSARYELSFDFSEEEHAEAAESELATDLQAWAGRLCALAGDDPMRTRRDTPEIALFGPPNAGKSSLLNALAGRTRALVSNLPGTTRDAVEHVLRLKQQEAKLVDLSGVGGQDADRGRFAASARSRAQAADILLLLCAPGQETECVLEFERLEREDGSVRARTIWIHSMSDLRDSPTGNPVRLPELAVSAASGAGLNELCDELTSRLADLAGGNVTSQMRRKSREALAIVLAAVGTDVPPEAAAGEVRRALRLLDEAMLSDTPGDVLDLIFSRFCIGK